MGDKIEAVFELRVLLQLEELIEAGVFDFGAQLGVLVEKYLEKHAIQDGLALFLRILGRYFREGIDEGTSWIGSGNSVLAIRIYIVIVTK